MIDVSFRRFAHLAGLFLVGSVTLSVLPVDAAATGGKCAKAGITQVTKGVSYICVKSGKKNVWKGKPSLVKSNSSTSTTTTTTIPLYSDPEITSVNNLLNVQECRIADVTFSQTSSNSSGFPRPGFLRSGLGQIEVLMIPVNFTDLSYSAADAEALGTTFSKVNSYFSSMSYGGASVRMTLAASNSWVDVGGTLEQNGLINAPPQSDGSVLYRKVIEIYSRNNSISGYDVVGVTSAYSTRTSGGQGMPSGSNSIYGTQKNFSGFQIIGSLTQKWDAIAHELGHNWLGFEDLYLFSVPQGGDNRFPFGNWDMMSMSGSEFSGWSRFLAGWIAPNWVRCASPRSQSRHYLSALNSGKIDDKPRMLVMPLSTNSAVVAEFRVPNEWKTDIMNPTLVVYQIDTLINHGNGPIKLVGIIDQKNGTVSTDGVIISVIGMDKSGVIIEVKN